MGRSLTLLGVGILIGLFGVEWTSACSCAQSYDPVCGEDGITYSNGCLLFCLNWGRAADGLPEIKQKCKGTCECCDPKPCNCNRCYDPVCGSDGNTYPNPCRLECENKKRKCEGLPEITVRCKNECEKCPDCICPMIYDPVCGWDGKTYNNKCLLNCANKERKKNGLPPIGIKCHSACRDCPKVDHCFCPAKIEPVCGSNGITYSNICVLNCLNKKKLAQEKPLIHLCSKKDCKKSPKCKGCACPKIYAPLCGSDSNTYENKCEFDCENKYRKANDLPILSERCKRTCDECVDESCNCDKTFNPVCGTDGNTYANKCLFNCENKRRYNNNLPPIKILCKRECKKCKEEYNRCDCPPIAQPVCGSDNVTYSNNCQIDCENFYREENNIPPLNVRCDKPCNKCSDSKCACDKQYKPLCGTNGKTYENKCLFDCENSRRYKKNLPLIGINCNDKCENCRDDCVCGDNYAPVCALDGNTYTNQCWVNCTNGERKAKGLPPIGIKCNATCDKCPKTSCICPKIFAPVCGSDGKTYNNKCLLDCENKKRDEKNKPHIKIICKKSCETCKEEIKRCLCDEEYDPVCGSDGETYTNECELDCGNFLREEDGLMPVALVCENVCEKCPSDDCVCPEIFAPVCTTEGDTFYNECEFNCENKSRALRGLKPCEIVCRDECNICDTDY